MKEFMNYPYPELVKVLQFYCEPKKYQRVLSKYAKSNGTLRSFNVGEDYWSIVPVYTRAICPICQSELSSPIDTYSLLGKGESTEIFYTELDEDSDLIGACSHFMATRQFLNLHGSYPTEKSYIRNKTGEIPIVSAWCLPNDIASYAVLHAIPVCRVAKGQFMPSYTRFFVSYFSEQREQVLNKRFEFERERGQGDPEFRPAIFYAPGPNPQDGIHYDLQAWSQRGKLGHLDFSSPDLDLKIGNDTQLPVTYRNIQGEKREYTWKNGEITYPLG